MNKQILSELQNNYKKLYYVVNSCFSIKELMGESKNKGIFCPFHGESRLAGSKPSARFYENQFPVKLWCFQERKSYYSYHYIKLIMKRDPLQYLITYASEKKILYYLKEYQEEFTDEEPTYNVNSLSDITMFYKCMPLEADYSNWFIV